LNGKTFGLSPFSTTGLSLSLRPGVDLADGTRVLNLSGDTGEVSSAFSGRADYEEGPSLEPIRELTERYRTISYTNPRKIETYNLSLAGLNETLLGGLRGPDQRQGHPSVGEHSHPLHTTATSQFGSNGFPDRFVIGKTHTVCIGSGQPR
jgi:hypothetical protein